VTKRPEVWYEERFSMEAEERVLDLGSGKSPYDSPGLIKLDYLYDDFHPSGEGRHVAGLFQELPFPDGAFDRVVSSWGLYHVRSTEPFEEALRVTRPGGTVEFFPAQRRKQRGFLKAAAGQLAIDGVAHVEKEVVVTRVASNKLITFLTWNALTNLSTGFYEGFSGVSIPDRYQIAASIGVGLVMAFKPHGTYGNLVINRGEEFNDPAVRQTFAEHMLDVFTVLRIQEDGRLLR
jgi:hypothetical protein